MRIETGIGAFSRSRSACSGMSTASADTEATKQRVQIDMKINPKKTFVLTPLVQKVPFDADKQLVPVVNVGTGTQVIAIRRSLPVTTLPESASDLLAHEDWIKSEVLAVAIETDGAGAEPTIAKV